MSEIDGAPKFGLWEELFQEALLETDRKTLTVLVELVEAAIVARRRQLENVEGNEKERAAMLLASKELLILKTEKLGWRS